ncbi:lytic transglycosylase domain-containing protein [Pontibacter silvestris]|nr:lytic transglycosylase domain-containing protein [Pontibacter silvestris]MCC9137682.1 lytic transglycosylase domain-containing protein [Pontibacter silvestris]
MLVLGQRVIVPQYISFADLSIKVSGKAQQEIQDKVDALHCNAKYFQKKVDLATIYFPVIESTLKEEGVPAEFKYFAMQESGLIGDTISRSNAVGFWQFKIEAASDFNLHVDYQVDERLHVIEATGGAAKYLKRSNAYYKNWLNSLLSYSLGLDGAKPYSTAAERGSRKVEITEKTHPYVLTFLAHKVAYESFLGKVNASPVGTAGFTC